MIHKYVQYIVGWGGVLEKKSTRGWFKEDTVLRSFKHCFQNPGCCGRIPGSMGKSFANLRHTAVPSSWNLYWPVLTCWKCLYIRFYKHVYTIPSPFLSHLQVKAKAADLLGIRRVQALVHSSDRPRSFDPATVLEALGGCRSSTRYFSQFPGEWPGHVQLNMPSHYAHSALDLLTGSSKKPTM